MATAFTILFGVAIFVLFALGIYKGRQWTNARLAAAIVAVVAFALALATAKVK
ncbi:MAG: hypothetical protein JOZ24_10930 [Candidatus Eremiobacteraeota bacterium]|nr:hypothetical protein [Candidatus Eremiobacteraeota bacterium]